MSGLYGVGEQTARKKSLWITATAMYTSLVSRPVKLSNSVGRTDCSRDFVDVTVDATYVYVQNYMETQLPNCHCLALSLGHVTSAMCMSGYQFDSVGNINADGFRCVVMMSNTGQILSVFTVQNVQ